MVWCQPHPVDPACICYQCLWRRVHWRFWASLRCTSVVFAAMQDIHIGDSQHTAIPETQDTHKQDDDLSAEFYQSFFASSRGGHVSVPDSYHIVNRAPLPGIPNASAPPGTRHAHDRLKPEHAPTFPNLHRVYDEKSRAVASVSWEFCSPQEIWSIVTCKFLGSGKCTQRTETMTYYRTQLLKYVCDLLAHFVRLKNDQQTSDKVLTLLCITLTALRASRMCSGSRTYSNNPTSGHVKCTCKQWTSPVS
jgi:hypothetical protein